MRKTDILIRLEKRGWKISKIMNGPYVGEHKSSSFLYKRAKTLNALYKECNNSI